jgi:hypothetical protein
LQSPGTFLFCTNKKEKCLSSLRKTFLFSITYPYQEQSDSFGDSPGKNNALYFCKVLSGKQAELCGISGGQSAGSATKNPPLQTTEDFSKNT